MGAAGELKAESNAYPSDVPTLTGSGNHPNSHLSAQRNNRSAVYHGSTFITDQSSESEGEKSSGTSFVNYRPYSDQSRSLRHNSASSINYNSKLTSQRRKSTGLSGFDRNHLGSASRPPLTCIDEASDDDIGRTHHQNSPVTSKRPVKTSSISSSGSRRYVSSSFFSRNRQSNLQQQLGSLPNASLQSIISSLTTSSGSSGNSTVTQKSYDKLAARRRRTAKRRRNIRDQASDRHSSRPSKSASDTKSDNMDTKESSDTQILKTEEDAQIQAAISRPASSTSRASRKDSILSPPTPSSRQHSTSSSRTSSRSALNTRWRRHDTFNSDSGISVTSSPEVQLPQKISHKDDSRDQDQDQDQNQGQDQEASDSSDEESSSEDESPNMMVSAARSSSATGFHATPSNRALPDTDPLVQRLNEQEEAMKQHILHSPQPKRSFRPQVTSSYDPSPALPLYDHHATSAVPSAYPMSPHMPGGPHGDPKYFQSYYDMHDSQHLRGPEPHFQFDVQKTTIAGYEMLANKLSQTTDKGERSMRPMYRKFEQLNHRVLLHLQDEIAELEEELRMLDEMITQPSLSLSDKGAPPASRRADARYGSDLHFQRTQTLGKVFLKLQQYNQALASYSAAKDKFTSALVPDVTAYRAWMNEHTPIDPTEAKFLNHEQDLIVPGRYSKSAPQTSTTVDLKQLIAAHCLMIILLLLAFSILPGLVAKLIFSSTVCCLGAAAWILQDRSIARIKKDA